MNHPHPTLRIARPTDRLADLVSMYTHGLGMTELGGFTDHEGCDGVMLGFSGQTYHLEFTHQRGVRAQPAPNAEHLLVFYEPNEERWSRACERMLAAGFERVAAHNPYWEREGQTFQDLDGYRVVWCRQEWTR